MITLGESIVITGATASGFTIDLARATAIAVAFIGTAALWWLYFSVVASVATRRLGASDDSGRMARDAYSHLHLPIVAGIIVTAVGDEIVIAHPGASLHAPGLIALAGGPILSLAGHLLLRLRMAGSVSWRRLVGTGAIVIWAALGAVLPALAVAALIVAVLVAVIASEALAPRRPGMLGPTAPIARAGGRTGA